MADAFDFVLVFVLFYMTCLLIYQYKITKITDYLIFSNLFSLTLIHRSFVILLNIDNDSVYSGSFPEWQYLMLIQINFIFSTIGWYSVFLIAGRLQDRKKGPVYYFMTIYLIILIILSFTMSITEIPNKFIMSNFTIHSTDFSGLGAAVIINNIVLFGQGYFYLLAGFRFIAAFGLFVMLGTVKNPGLYPHFKKVQVLWLFSMFWYMSVQSLYLSQTFIGFQNLGALIELARMMSTFSLFFVAIVYPHGFLLPNAQIMRANKLLKDNPELLKDKAATKIFNLNPLIDYLMLIEDKKAE